MAFSGGIVAGLLGLSLSEDPLKDWLERTAAGTTTGVQVRTMVAWSFTSVSIVLNCNHLTKSFHYHASGTSQHIAGQHIAGPSIAGYSRPAELAQRWR